MFFSIGPQGGDAQFSYIIAKHPQSIFDRDLGGGRRIVGRFSEDGQYCAHIENDPKTFLETARQLNLSNYVHVQLSAVCPHNLKALDRAQPLYSLVKIPNGWKHMGEMEVGDIVCTPDGKTAPVTGVFPQGLRPVYRITFEDGRVANCCNEHLWKVFKGQRKEAQILNLQQMLEWITNHKECLYIPLLDSLYSEDRELPIDPYILGCLLGDGCLSLEGALTLASADQEIIENISARLEQGYRIQQSTSKHNSYTYTIKGTGLRGVPGIRKCVNLYKNALDSMGLIERYSYEKFIPELYKESSSKQRLELLQGLMDTDGTVDCTGWCSFTSTSHQLALDVQYLVRSLGGLAKITIFKGGFSARRQKNDRNFYTVKIRHPHMELFFKLSRKKDRAFKTKNIKNKIKSIKFIGEVECQCIRIDHPDHLYITDNFIVTHNTFNSALRGKCSGLSEEDFFKPRALQAVIGPYPGQLDRLQKIFEELHIKAERHAENAALEAFMLQLETVEDMSVTEFLQKIYLISFYSTIRYNLARIEEEQIAKFVTFCKDWLIQSSFRNSIINTLCRHNKELMSKFETGLIAQSEASDEEKSEKLSAVEAFLRKQNLHEKRHNAILPLLAGKKTLIDLCCGEGRFIRMVHKTYPDLEVVGVEADERRAGKAHQVAGKSSKVQIVHSNVFFPRLEQTIIHPEFLTLIEALEHIPTKEQRDQLLILIRDLFQPIEFAISVPNIEYNVQFGMQPGELRHPDHAIEYTFEQLQEDVIAVLSESYAIEFIPLEMQPIRTEDLQFDSYRADPSDLTTPECAVRVIHKPTGFHAHSSSEKVYHLNKVRAMKLLTEQLFPPREQPSFIIHGKRIADRKPCTKLYRKTQELYHDIYLDTVDFTVNASEIAAGLTSRQVLMNGKNIFFLAPTIAPVEYTDDAPDFLEHPLACHQYFRSRGLSFVASEKKYMGSRAYILAFRTPEIAKASGFDLPIIVNSRQGYPFTDEQTLQTLYAELQPKLVDDFVMLDAEVLPWKYKAKNLIQYDFRYPGECCYLSRLYGQYGSLQNAEKYLNALNIHAADGPLEVRMFQLLAKGTGKNVINGFYMSKIDMYSELGRLEGDIFKPVEYEIVDLTSADAAAKDVVRWTSYCEKGGEGFVYKPWSWNSKRLPSGCYIQPALKVRGREYLRLIYGIDYLEPQAFDLLKHRRIKSKRALAIQEFELSLRILNAFLHRNRRELLKAVAGFIGTEHYASTKMDATL